MEPCNMYVARAACEKQRNQSSIKLEGLNVCYVIDRYT